MAPTSQEQDDATSACLKTTELLEAILLRLDSRTVIQAQLVSHKFHIVINSNAAFQQRLFLAPASPAETQEPSFRPNQQERPYILVEKLEDTEAADAKLNDPQLAQAREARCTQLAVLNPFFFDLPKWRGEKEWPAQMRFTRALGLVKSGEVLPESSPLRKMYLALPMPALVRFRIPQRSHYLFGGRVVRGRGEGLRPRTLGEMMEEVESGCRFDDGYGWAGVKVQLGGRRLPEYAKPGTSRKARRLEKRGWTGDSLNKKAVGRDVQRGMEEPEDDAWRLFEG